MLRLSSLRGQFNGSALVADNGKVIFKRGFGLANMEWNIANEPDTKFRLGSITKQFTAVAILMGFGHSILAMSGEESLAQVYREIEKPKVKNLQRAGMVPEIGCERVAENVPHPLIRGSKFGLQRDVALGLPAETVEILQRPADEQFASCRGTWDVRNGVINFEDERVGQFADVTEAAFGDMLLAQSDRHADRECQDDH